MKVAVPVVIEKDLVLPVLGTTKDQDLQRMVVGSKWVGRVDLVAILWTTVLFATQDWNRLGKRMARQEHSFPTQVRLEE